MNIFHLDPDPFLCARYHADIHMKMLMEAGQIMATAHHLAGGSPPPDTFRPAFVHHPCCRWAAESLQNYLWLGELGMHLCREYTERYGRIHAKQDAVVRLTLLPPPLPDVGFTPPVQAMPVEFRVEGDPVAAYRRYYNECKAHTIRMNWKHGEVPWWYDPGGWR